MTSNVADTPSPGVLVPKGCSSLKLRQLSRRVSQLFDEVISPTGMKTSQYSLLSNVVRLGPARPGELAAAMEMDASTLTRNLQPLVTQGWVLLGPGSDGRSRLVTATLAGVAKQANVRKQWKRAQLAFNGRLGTERVARLHVMLDECLHILHESGSADDQAA